MGEHAPQVIVLGGPNGAGKTTAAGGMLRDYLGLGEFVNADAIAAGLAAYDVEGAAMAAGRIMLGRLRELSAARANFAFETTMASKTFAPFLAGLKSSGYHVNVVFVALGSPELAIDRVRLRVSQGGHNIPEDVIRRRFGRAKRNFVQLYLPLADRLTVYDNSSPVGPSIIARRPLAGPTEVYDALAWAQLLELPNE